MNRTGYSPKDTYITSVNWLIEYLDIPDPSPEAEAIEDWVAQQSLSEDEFLDSQLMARLYEEEQVRAVSLKELPLMIGTLHSKRAIDLLQQRLKGES